jgi:hypothetical protein
MFCFSTQIKADDDTDYTERVDEGRGLIIYFAASMAVGSL